MSDKDMLPFVEALHYIIGTYNLSAKGTTIFRDEDIMYPQFFDMLNILEPVEIFNRLAENI